MTSQARAGFRLWRRHLRSACLRGVLAAVGPERASGARADRWRRLRAVFLPPRSTSRAIEERPRALGRSSASVPCRAAPASLHREPRIREARSRLASSIISAAPFSRHSARRRRCHRSRESPSLSRSDTDRSSRMLPAIGVSWLRLMPLRTQADSRAKRRNASASTSSSMRLVAAAPAQSTCRTTRITAATSRSRSIPSMPAATMIAPHRPQDVPLRSPHGGHAAASEYPADLRRRRGKRPLLCGHRARARRTHAGDLLPP